MHKQPIARLVASKTACATLMLLLALAAATAQTKRRTRRPTKYVPVSAYDPKRDADKDIQNAIREAERTHKNIFLEVGGEWCSWCHTLDRFFLANPALLKLRDKNFVTVKINFSDENKNQEVLSRYGEIEGFPHMFFLDSHGKLLQSQETGVLENGKGYNLEKLTEVLKKWGPSVSGQ